MKRNPLVSITPASTLDTNDVIIERGSNKPLAFHVVTFNPSCSRNKTHVTVRNMYQAQDVRDWCYDREHSVYVLDEIHGHPLHGGDELIGDAQTTAIIRLMADIHYMRRLGVDNG